MYYYILSCRHIFEDTYEYKIGEPVICEIRACGTHKVVKEFENGDFVALI